MEITVNSELYKKVLVCQDIYPGTKERVKSQSEQVMKRSRKLALEKSSPTHVLNLTMTLGEDSKCGVAKLTNVSEFKLFCTQRNGLQFLEVGVEDQSIVTTNL